MRLVAGCRAGLSGGAHLKPDARRIDLPGGDVTFAPHWLAPAEADRLLLTLRASLPWEVHRIRMFGRVVDSPRLSAWIGDEDATYRYSGSRFAPRPWTRELLLLRDRLAEACGVPFNSVLANLYRDGNDRMGWHSDDEPELGPAPVIASVSLGAERTFRLRAKSGGEPVAIELTHGSLLCMAGDTQRLYKHELPARKRVQEPRINLTFRQLAAGAQR